MTDRCLENPRLRLSLATQDGRLTGAVQDQQTGHQWGPVPLLALEIRDRMQERTERLYDLKVMHIEGDDRELHLTVRETFRGVTVGLWLAATADGELRLIVPPAEVEEVNDVLYRLYAVDLLPGLLTVGSDGRLLLPCGTGTTGSPAGKAQLADRFLIYGEQERWELVPTIPTCGVQSPAGGLLLLATQGAQDMYCDVRTDGQGHGSVGLYPMLRSEWIDPVDWCEREVRIAALAADDDLPLAAARRLRRHLLADHGKPTLRQRAEASPQCAYQQQAYTMKMFHGIQRQGIMMYGRERDPETPLYQRTLTFAEAERCCRQLQAAGLDRVCLQSVGWNPKGHDGAWPTDFPIDRRLGGEAGCRAMIETAKALGYQITTHLNLGMACFASPDFNPDYVVTDLWGEPKVTGDWGGGVHGSHWGLALPEALVTGRLLALRDLGCNGMQYLDFQGNPLYRNYHPCRRGPRGDFAAGIRRYQDAARQVFGGVQIELGFFYCVAGVDAVCGPYYTPFRPWRLDRPHWPVTALCEQPAPVWQLATHDLVTQEQQGVTWPAAMNAVLFGRVMRDEWSAEPGVMPVLDDDRIARIKAIYDLVTVRHGHLVTEEITAWQRLDELVERTRFADGTEVVADFAAQRLRVNGTDIPAPQVLAE